MSIYATKLPALPYYGSFFGDSEAICVGMPGVHEGGQRGDEHLVISLGNAGRIEHFDRFDPTGTMFVYSAIEDRLLLGSGFNHSTNKTDLLIKSEANSFKEIERVPFAEKRSSSIGKSETFLMVSADRRTFVYTVDNSVVCSRTRTLGLSGFEKPIRP